MNIDGKFFSLIVFLLAQLGAAIWWAGVKNEQVSTLQRDLGALTTHMDKQLDRMERKLDRIGLPARPSREEHP